MNNQILSCRSIAALLLISLATSFQLNAQEGLVHEVVQINRQVEGLYTAGRYLEAIPLAQRALATQEKAFGPDHPETSTSLNNLALLYFSTGSHTKAEQLYQRALAIRRKSLGAEHPDTATSFDNLAALYLSTGAYAKAEPLHQRALAIREKSLKPDHPDTAASLSNLAQLYFSTGAYAKAEPLYHRALTIRKKVFGPDHPETAHLLNNLAALYFSTSAYAKAEPLYQHALAIQEKSLGPDHPDTATSLNNLALLFTATGAYTKAEPLCLRAITIQEKALGRDHPHTATSLDNLAALYFATGTYAKAEPLHQRALAIREKVLKPDHPDTATSLNHLAQLYFSTGAYAKAEPLYQHALAIQEKSLGPDHPDTATSLNNLALLYASAGAYTKAEPLHQRALTIREKVLGPDHPETTTSLNNLALLYFSTGAYIKAEPLYQRALATRERVPGPDHPDTATSLNNLALLYASSGAYANSEPLAQRALAIREKVLGPEHPDTATSLYDLATLYFSTGAFMQAELLYARAQAIDERNATRFLLSGSESRKQQYLRRMAETVNLHVSVSLSYSTARSRVLGLTSVLSYKGRVLDAMSDSMAQLRRNAKPKDRALLDKLSYVAQELSALIFRSLANSVPGNREHFDTLTQQQESLQAELSSRSAVSAKALAPVTLDSVRRTLPVDAVLIEWIRYRPFDLNPPTRWLAPRYAAYILKPTGDPTAIDVGEAEPIENLIVSFRNALTDPTTDSRGASRTGSGRVGVRELAAELFERLFKPLGPHLLGRERMLISPDGALNLVPFAALLDEHGEYLAEKFEISYLTSGRDLLRITDTPARSSDVVLADPTYGGTFEATSTPSARSADLDRSGLVFNPLPGTAAEAKVLQVLLGLDTQHVLTGDRATEAQLRALHGPRILHLATHGFFLKDEDVAAPLNPFLGLSTDRPAPALGENPLWRSGLALAGANQRGSGATDDGILTAAEVAQLDLLGTQLVVLSACETALGTVNAGEGVYGLRRALVLAGAQSQLVSLWKVDDAATSELMTDYYQRLLKGEGRAAALRAVQRAMLAAPLRQHPYYWAAFIPIGNWTPLQ